ncbi:MarR family winged helix-turn-helix transcriptional regulator [Oceanibacterium hippocampi]|uniref:HTH-type transcriptional repressor NicR n=1 Tax=Oceanibacterium hippocampi TaxID=745714 RepID=A0A1Y5RG49_9PROT|nr:MarR family transcriptional regulator [Oceanibacterium hippocampi]SLN16435.1 HTH-type transcriptional repressor NicR [Oceanibacterium hippocampi]
MQERTGQDRSSPGGKEEPARPGSAADQRAQRGFDLGILPELVGYNIRRAQVLVFQDFARRIERHRITPGQFGVLTIIHRNAGLNQSDLGQAMGVDRSTVVAVIGRLEKRGLVERRPAPNDRRSYALHLSPQGETLYDVLAGDVRAHDEGVTEALDAGERAELIALLKKLNGNGAS